MKGYRYGNVKVVEKVKSHAGIQHGFNNVPIEKYENGKCS